MKIEHITISVNDMEKSIEFYKSVTGITVQKDLRSYGVPVVFMADSAESTKIELFGGEDGYQGSGLSIGFGVKDIDAEFDRVKALGYELSGIVSPNPTTKFFFVTDPNGVKIQLIEEK